MLSMGQKWSAQKSALFNVVMNEPGALQSLSSLTSRLSCSSPLLGFPVVIYPLFSRTGIVTFDSWLGAIAKVVSTLSLRRFRIFALPQDLEVDSANLLAAHSSEHALLSIRRLRVFVLAAGLWLR